MKPNWLRPLVTRRTFAVKSRPLEGEDVMKTVGTEKDLLLTAKQVAEILCISTPTLCRWRQMGEGPAWVSLGPASPRYRRADVDAFVRRQTDPR